MSFEQQKNTLVVNLIDELVRNGLSMDEQVTVIEKLDRCACIAELVSALSYVDECLRLTKVIQATIVL